MSRRYLDSDIFLGLFNEEPDKLEACNGVLTAAERGEIEIVVSALTLTEVIRMRGRPRLEQEKEEFIHAFFEHSFIHVVNLDRGLAEDARQLMWDYSALKPKDSVHVATAIRTQVNCLHTFDRELLGLDGQIGQPLLHICTPDIPGQTALRFPSEAE